jgi:hypothetical protein
MKRGRWTLLAGAGMLLLAPFGVRALEGCYSAVPNDGLVDAGPPPDVGKLPPPGDGGFVGPGPVCDAASGVVPDPACHFPFKGPDGGLECTPKVPASVCAVGKTADGTSCGEPSCLPLTSNVAPNYNFRMSSLHIVGPSALASPINQLLQNDIVTSAVTLNAPTCGYDPAGGSMSLAGSFNWLISVTKNDGGTGSLVTGGAPPTPDPYKTGYCFVHDSPEGGIPVAPLEAGVKFTGNTFSTNPVPGVLNIPIFQSPTLLTDPIILPIRGAQLSDVTISPDGNCIGDINPEWYAFAGGGSAGCSDEQLATCPKWFTNGALAGYITLADAAAVKIIALGGQSLCQLLLSLPGACTPADYSMGNYCSTTQSPGGCGDSVWLAATFAADAVKINTGGSSICGK